MKRTALRRGKPMKRRRSKPRRIAAGAEPVVRLRGKALQELYRAVFMRDGWKCRYCGRSRNGLHPHHIIYKSHNGPDTMANLISLCNDHHLFGIHDGKLWVTGDADTAVFSTTKPEAA